MRCCNHKSGQRCGFTLLEVIVGTVLLASLIVGVLTATGAHQRKISLVRQKADAVRMADELLSVWHSGSSRVPLNAYGTTAGGTMTWRTHVVGSRQLCQVPIHVVRLSIHQRVKGSALLCHVDVVVDAEWSQL